MLRGPVGRLRTRPVLICIKTVSTGMREIGGMKERPLTAPHETKILVLSEETQLAANGIVSRTLLNTAHSRVILFGFAEGQELSEHTSTQHALIQILSGECEFSLDGQWHTLQAGALLHMPPHLRHAVRAGQPFSMLLTLIKPALTLKADTTDPHCCPPETSKREHYESHRLHSGFGNP